MALRRSMKGSGVFAGPQRLKPALKVGQLSQR
jgi:hypothetical protein